MKYAVYECLFRQELNKRIRIEQEDLEYLRIEHATGWEGHKQFYEELIQTTKKEINSLERATQWLKGEK